jgi:hypothetical protein
MATAGEPPSETAAGPRVPRTRPRPWLRAGPGESAEALRARYGVLVVLAGFSMTLGAFVAALIVLDTAQAISTALAPITGLIGTIVGAYFGIQKGAEGKQAVEEQRQQAEQRAHAAERQARTTTAKLAGAIPDVRMVAWALDSAPPPHMPTQPPAPPAATGAS